MVQRSDHTCPEAAQLLHGLWAQAQRQRGIQRVVPETRHMTPTNVWPVSPAPGQAPVTPGLSLTSLSHTHAHHHLSLLSYFCFSAM